jgi:nucleoid-associated protein YgaU
VTLCDPHNWTLITARLADGNFGRTAGDRRQFGNNRHPGLEGHDVNRNMALNFATTIRRDLGLPPLAVSQPSAPTAHLSAPSRKRYTVKPGDPLSQIARSFYGDMHAWRRIYEANKLMIGGNPDRIFPGQQLVIP